MINRSTLIATAVTGASLVALSVAAAGPAGAAAHREVHLSGSLAAAGTGSSAVSYDPALAPVGARVSVAVVDGGEGRARIGLDVSGLLPDHAYVASAQAEPCGADAAAAAAGGLRMELQTDGDGAGRAEGDVVAAAGALPRSVVVHDGAAAAGVACITLPGR